MIEEQCEVYKLARFSEDEANQILARLSKGQMISQDLRFKRRSVKLSNRFVNKHLAHKSLEHTTSRKR